MCRVASEKKTLEAAVFVSPPKRSIKQSEKIPVDHFDVEAIQYIVHKFYRYTLLWNPCLLL